MRAIITKYNKWNDLREGQRESFPMILSLVIKTSTTCTIGLKQLPAFCYMYATLSSWYFYSPALDGDSEQHSISEHRSPLYLTPCLTFGKNYLSVLAILLVAQAWYMLDYDLDLHTPLCVWCLENILSSVWLWSSILGCAVICFWVLVHGQ